MRDKLLTLMKRGSRWNVLHYDSKQDLLDSKDFVNNTVSLVCKRGSLIMADTSSLHRGKPGILKDRYSLTYYAYKDTVPNHIQEISNKSRDLFL